MRFLAVDHGDKRTGLAICDAAETLATPHSVIETQNESHLLASIERVIDAAAIEAVVLGLPLNMDGSEGARAKGVRAFAEKLAMMISVPIHFHDERLSSYAAESLLFAAEMTRKDKKKRLDAVAAADILRSFLQTRCADAAPAAQPTILRAADPDALADKLAEIFINAAEEAVAQRGAFYVAISGGKTPERFFRRLAQPDISKRIDWNKTHLFWADERCVPPDSPDSNYALAMRTFLGTVPIRPEQVYRVHGEYDDCVRAADAYEATLMAVFDLDEGQVPCFDLIVLGLGSDGHIASLLPGDPGVRVEEQLTWPVYHDTRLNRVTLTAPVLQNAHRLAVLVSGAGKAEIVRSLFSSPPDAQRYPAYVLWPSLDKTVWLVDAAAAALL